MFWFVGLDIDWSMKGKCGKFCLRVFCCVIRLDYWEKSRGG